MLHYLFTNDLRRNMWPDILVESAKLIRDDKVPDQSEDKSKNNYINTQQSYLCINRGSKANEVCCNGDVKAVILNFVNRFQYPNARTSDSYRDSSNDGMSVAPLRLAVQLLFILNQIDESEAHISYAELAKYIICDQGVATGVSSRFPRRSSRRIFSISWTAPAERSSPLKSSARSAPRLSARRSSAGSSPTNIPPAKRWWSRFSARTSRRSSRTSAAASSTRRRRRPAWKRLSRGSMRAFSKSSTSRRRRPTSISGATSTKSR